MKKILEKTNLSHITNKVYPISNTNEVKEQIQKAKKSKIGNTHSIVHNIIKK